MPHKGSRTEPDPITGLLESPAQINVVPCLAKYGIEPANLQQDPFEKSHVATGNVFSLAIRQHNVRRAARGNHDSRSDRRILRGKQVRAANTHKFAAR